MTEHVSSEEIVRFLRRELDRARIEEIGAHVAACDACSEMLLHSSDFAGATDSLWDAASAAPAARRITWWLAAAAILAAAIGILLFLRPSAPHQQVPLVVHTRPTRPPVAAVDYGRPEWNDDMRAAEATRRLTTPAFLRDLRVPGESLRGSNPDEIYRVEAPIGVAVESDRPRFTWTAPPGPARVRVVRDDDSEAVVSPPLADARAWTPDRPLERGRRYRWQVRIESSPVRTLPGPGEPPAYFYVIDKAGAEEIEAARKTGNPVLLAVVLAKHGLVGEAKDVLSRVDSALARELRASLIQSEAKDQR